MAARAENTALTAATIAYSALHYWGVYSGFMSIFGR